LWIYKKFWNLFFLNFNTKHSSSLPQDGSNSTCCKKATFSHVSYLLTYLCGTTTNIWLRPDQEDLSMTCISRLTSFVGVIRDPRYTKSLTTSNCLSPIATLCPTSRIIPSCNHIFCLFFIYF
jgi:hypothetical protein